MSRRSECLRLRFRCPGAPRALRVALFLIRHAGSSGWCSRRHATSPNARSTTWWPRNRGRWLVHQKAEAQDLPAMRAQSPRAGAYRAKMSAPANPCARRARLRAAGCPRVAGDWLHRANFAKNKRFSFAVNSSYTIEACATKPALGFWFSATPETKACRAWAASGKKQFAIT